MNYSLKNLPYDRTIGTTFYCNFAAVRSHDLTTLTKINTAAFTLGSENGTNICSIVAVLGLFSLASFTTERRTEEIGIRKVMGASARDIVMLLTTDFMKIVLLANVIAWPLAHFFMKDWLNRFVYQAPFADWAWLFVASAVAGDVRRIGVRARL